MVNTSLVNMSWYASTRPDSGTSVLLGWVLAHYGTFTASSAGSILTRWPDTRPTFTKCWHDVGPCWPSKRHLLWGYFNDVVLFHSFAVSMDFSLLAWPGSVPYRVCFLLSATWISVDPEISVVAADGQCPVLSVTCLRVLADSFLPPSVTEFTSKVTELPGKIASEASEKCVVQWGALRHTAGPLQPCKLGSRASAASVLTPGDSLHTGPSLKTIFPGIGISVINLRHSWDCLVFIMGIRVLMQHHYIELRPTLYEL